VLRKVQPQGGHKPFHVLTKLEFHDLWHNLNVPNEVDLLKQLQSGLLSPSACVLPITLFVLSGGLQETASEAPVIKTPMGKKRGKKGTRQRTTRLTNTHLKGMGIDLSKDYVAPGK
jgi:transcription initiation factor TFIIE subunit beta